MHEYLGRSGVGEPKRVYKVNVYRNRQDAVDFFEEARPEFGGETRGWIQRLNDHGYISSNDFRLGASVVFLGSSRYSGSDKDALLKGGAELLRRTIAPVWYASYPKWLRLGDSALHLHLSFLEAGLISDHSMDLFRRVHVNSANATHSSLASLENHRGFESLDGAHAYAYLATELLASRAGPEALLRYFGNVQMGTSWKTIFKDVFGMSANEFYGLFEAHRNAGFPKVSILVPNSTPDVEPMYSITTVSEEYGWEIDLPRGWIDDGQSIKSVPGGELQVREIELRAGTTLEKFADSVIDNLRQDWWLTASRFEVNRVEKRQVAGNEFYFVEYVVQESPKYCALDVWELIAVGSSLPGSVKGYRAQHRLCEHEAREWESRRLDRTRRATLESFRVVTRPATYYRQIIDVEGIIVKANEEVRAKSMYNTAHVIDVMMASLRDDIRRCLVRQGAAMAISPLDELITTLPEFYPQIGELDYAGGLGAVKGQPVSGSVETSVVAGGYDVVLHEFAHAIQNLCFTKDEQRDWDGFYDETYELGVFPDAYGMTNDDEFFAEFSISYFEQLYQTQGRWTYIEDEFTREQLSEDFPEVFAFLEEIYPDFEPEPYEPSITSPRPTATPIAFEATSPDQEALVALYKSTDGGNWNNNTNWLTDEPLNRWHGVSTQGGRVTGLHLGDGGLRGKLPPELGNLTQLRELWLGGDNDLEGEIPDEMSRLSRLEVLDFGSIGLDGPIPDWIGDFIHLWYLHLDDNNFVGEVPAELGNLTRLRSFTLNGNSGLSGPLPESLASISGLGRFEYHATGLCAPFESRFQNWLQGISDLYESGNICPSDSAISDDEGGQAIVRDIFGRVVNETGIVLVDWEGHIANPLMAYTIEFPAGSTSPMQVVLSSSETRLYFDLPSSAGANGPSKTLVPDETTQTIEFSISIFPDRDTVDESHELNIRYLDAFGRVRATAIDVHVIDQDLDLPLEFNIIADFSHDETGFFDDPASRAAVLQAADDWAYFIAGMDLDGVGVGEEAVWVNEPGAPDRRRVWGEGHHEKNREAYTGIWVSVYGGHRGISGSGGGAQPFWYGQNQTARGVELPMKRSGFIDINPDGSYGLYPWLTSLDEEDWWYAEGGSNTEPDLYSVALHEFGHVLCFNEGHDGFASFWDAKEVSYSPLTEYYGSNPRMNENSHFFESVDPVSKRGGYGNEYGREVAGGRWLVTKFDLLILEAIGYTLRDTSPFIELHIADESLPGGTTNEAYMHTFDAVGGIPAYYWTVESGALPEGLILDSFTGTISGTPTEAGTFEFTVRVRDQTEGHVGVTRALTLIVGY